MKKIFASIILCFAVVASVGALAFPSAGVADAMPLNDDEFDLVFKQAIAQTLEYENYDDAQIVANKELLFDTDSKQLGFVYDFTVNGNGGFAIVVNTQGFFEITELYLDALSPYAYNDNVNNVYLALGQYAYFADGKLYLAESNVEISVEDGEAVLKAYSDYDSPLTYESETITYTHKSENKKNLSGRHPACIGMMNTSNSCAPVAGTNIIQYYDRFSPNLIADFEPGTPFANTYFYTTDNATLENVKIALASDMSTNNPNPGTTITQFKNGMTKYCNDRGYTFSAQSCMSNGKFSYSIAKQKIDAGQPLVLFVDPFNVITLMAQNSKDIVYYMFGSIAHAMAAFGYNEITYTLADGTTRKDYYLAVASGMSERTSGYCNVNYNTVIDDCYGVVIS